MGGRRGIGKEEGNRQGAKGAKTRQGKNEWSGVTAVAYGDQDDDDEDQPPPGSTPVRLEVRP